MKLQLNRKYESGVQTRGELHVFGGDGNQAGSCLTLELPWRDNRNGVSRIPAGGYEVSPRPAEHSGAFGYDHFIISSVPGRSYILIHQGAFFEHTAGCVLVGTEFQDINDDGRPDLLGSEEAMDMLRGLVTNSAQIEVLDPGQEPAEPLPDVAAEAEMVPAAEPEEMEIDLPETPDLG